MALTIPRRSRGLRAASAGKGSPTRVQGQVLPRPRSPELDTAGRTGNTPGLLVPSPAPAPTPVGSASRDGTSPAATSPADVTPFLELLEDVLAGGSTMGRRAAGVRERFRRWLLPVGTSGEPLILFCGWALALIVALAAYADIGPFGAGTRDVVLMLATEGLLTAVVLAGLAVAKARHRVRIAKSGASGGSARERDRGRTRA